MSTVSAEYPDVTFASVDIENEKTLADLTKKPAGEA